MSEMRRLRVEGLDLNVREVGEGRPLLLINGIGAHTAMWAPVERKLLATRLISYDSPGAGHSPLAWPLPTMGALADLAAGLLDRLGYDRVDVLGYSFGGAVAQQLARRHPGKVRRMVLAATMPGWGGAIGGWRSTALIHNPLRYFSRSFYDRTIGDLAGGQARWDEQFRRRHAGDRMAAPPNLVGYWAQMAALGTWSSLPWLHQVEAPTLVVCGDDDPLVPPANSMLLASHIPRARLVRVPDEGHLMLFDDRSEAHAPIQDFLEARWFSASVAWQQADRPTRRQAAAAARVTQPLPWTVASSAYRRMVDASQPRPRRSSSAQ